MTYDPVDACDVLVGLSRIVIVGSPGSGKTRLARHLSRITGVPHVCLDDHYWSAGWVRPQADAWTRRISRLLLAERWIMDGNYLGSMHLRLKAAQAVIYLDLPTPACVLGLFQRLLTQTWSPGRALPKRIGGSMRMVDRFYLDPKLLRMVWRFRRCVRPGVIAEIARLDDTIPVIVLRSRAEVDALICRLEKLRSARRSAP